LNSDHNFAKAFFCHVSKQKKNTNKQADAFLTGLLIFSTSPIYSQIVLKVLLGLGDCPKKLQLLFPFH
jgi:hypothetical protein